MSQLLSSPVSFSFSSTWSNIFSPCASLWIWAKDLDKFATFKAQCCYRSESFGFYSVWKFYGFLCFFLIWRFFQFGGFPCLKVFSVWRFSQFGGFLSLEVFFSLEVFSVWRFSQIGGFLATGCSLLQQSSTPLSSQAATLADCPAMSFVFVCWQINIRNRNQLSWAMNRGQILCQHNRQYQHVINRTRLAGN